MAHAAAAASMSIASPSLHGVFFLQPLAAEASGLHVECALSDGRFEVRGGMLGASAAAPLEDAAVHCSGGIASGGQDGSHTIETATARGSACVHASDVVALYNGFDAVGLQYGPRYRTLSQAWGGNGVASARLRAGSAWHGTQVHPADLDDALCAGALASSGESDGGGTRLPFAVDDARLRGAPGELWAVRLWLLFCATLFCFTHDGWLRCMAGCGASGR